MVMQTVIKDLKILFVLCINVNICIKNVTVRSKSQCYPNIADTVFWQINKVNFNFLL